MIPKPFYAWNEHFAIDMNGARAAFTTRRGGVSSGAYESLNLGRLTDDEPDAVEENRSRLERLVGRRLTFVRQVHGTRVELRPPEELREADGQITTQAGLAPVALSADCLPIALASRGAVAMLHAGWRGLADGIIVSGVSALREAAPDSEIHAAIGPGAGPCCYEVSDEVHGRFEDVGPLARRESNLDLKAIARHQLISAGVTDVHDIGLCTICASPPLFFSHRREGGVTGRQAGAVWLS